MYGKIKDILATELKNIEEAGLWKGERIILSPQSASIKVKQGDVLNFCANNYLGLANNAQLVAAAASGTLDLDVLDRVQAGGVTSIVAGANHPFAADAPGDTSVEQDADDRFAIVADIIASCGTAHAFACQSQSDFPLQPRIVFESIETTVAEAVDEAVQRAGNAQRGLLAAALAMALERCDGAPGTQNQPE